MSGAAFISTALAQALRKNRKMVLEGIATELRKSIRAVLTRRPSEKRMILQPSMG
jgi:hypothetical protein